MRFQFSLATMLVCLTIVAIACAVAVSVPVQKPVKLEPPSGYELFDYHPSTTRPPTGLEIGQRVALWSAGPIIAVLLGPMLYRRQRCTPSRNHRN